MRRRFCGDLMKGGVLSPSPGILCANSSKYIGVGRITTKKFFYPYFCKILPQLISIKIQEGQPL